MFSYSFNTNSKFILLGSVMGSNSNQFKTNYFHCEIKPLTLLFVPSILDSQRVKNKLSYFYLFMSHNIETTSYIYIPRHIDANLEFNQNYVVHTSVHPTSRSIRSTLSFPTTYQRCLAVKCNRPLKYVINSFGDLYLHHKPPFILGQWRIQEGDYERL